MREIGSELKDFFKTKGLTQKQVAEMAGLPTTYITKLIKGERRFGEKMALKWETLFGLSHVYLMTGEGNMVISEQDERPVPAWLFKELQEERDEWRDKCRDLEKEISDLVSRLAKYEHIEKEAV